MIFLKKTILHFFVFNLFLFVAFPTVIQAYTPIEISPQQGIYRPSEKSLVFIDWADDIQRLVIQPEFSTNAREFGLVMPVPARPVISSVSRTFFTELNKFTHPTLKSETISEIANTDMSVFSAQSDVTVVEEQQVGGYIATTLEAKSSESLITWLNKNSFDYSDKEEEIFSYYVNAGNFYFVALKVNFEMFESPLVDLYYGGLEPIEFAFASQSPMLPMYSMSGDEGPRMMELFTLGDNPIFIPASPVLYSRLLKTTDFPEFITLIFPGPWFTSYETTDRWLVRQLLVYDPRSITSDVFLTIDGTTFTVNSGEVFLPVPEKHNAKTGIVAFISSENGEIVFKDPTDFVNPIESMNLVGENTVKSIVETSSYDPLFSSRLLYRGVRGDDVSALQKFLNDMQGENLVTDGVWGNLTELAVKRFQTKSSVKIDGIVGDQTREIIHLELETL